jgi:replication-associated recombination protein RarA
VFIVEKKGIQMISDVTIESCQPKKPKPLRKEPKPLLAEILRPQNLSDLTLPAHTIQRLQRVIETGSMMNMLFYGPPGSGKTGAARMFASAIRGYLLVDRSFKTSPNLARYIEGFVRRGSCDACIVDQAHFIPKRDQTALPDIIESWSRHCRFLFAATDIKTLIPSLRSRLTEISFEVGSEDREEVQKAIDETLREYLTGERYQVGQGAIGADCRCELPGSTLDRQ